LICIYKTIMVLIFIYGMFFIYSNKCTTLKVSSKSKACMPVSLPIFLISNNLSYVLVENWVNFLFWKQLHKVILNPVYASAWPL
jgi:hypothetical protein